MAGSQAYHSFTPIVLAKADHVLLPDPAEELTSGGHPTVVVWRPSPLRTVRVDPEVRTSFADPEVRSCSVTHEVRTSVVDPESRVSRVEQENRTDQAKQREVL